MKVWLLLVTVFLLLNCKNELAVPKANIYKSDHKLNIKYAKGFSVKDYLTHKVLTITKPWPNAKSTYRYALVPRQKKTNFNIESGVFDAVISYPLQRIVVTSTTHIAALELLNVEKTLVGFPGTDYISSQKTRRLIAAEKIRELGKNENLNTEVLLTLQPDVIVTFGVDGTNKTMDILENAKIPVIYNGDWVEDSPLAKAEWLKLFGLLYNMEEKATQVFDTIENNYNEAKAIARNTKKQPTILSGAMYQSVWYLPHGESSEGQLLKDANVNYLWQDSSGRGSLSLSFETVFNRAKNADIWLNPSYYASYKALEDANTLYTNFKAFKTKSIFSIANTKGETGGLLYYELGVTRPDLVLKDIIKICHPEVLTDYEPYFFKPLE